MLQQKLLCIGNWKMSFPFLRKLQLCYLGQQILGSRKSSNLPSCAFQRDERQDRLQSPSYKKTRLTYDLLNQWRKFLVSLELGICFKTTLLILGTNLYHQSLGFGEQPLVSDSCEESPGKRHSKVSLACS